MQPRFTALDAVEHPELHEDSIALLQTFKRLQHFMTITGVKDFSLRVRADWPNVAR